MAYMISIEKLSELLSFLHSNPRGLCHPNIGNAINATLMRNYGIGSGENLFYIHCEDDVFLPNSKVFCITTWGIHYSSYFQRWEDIESVVAVQDRIGFHLVSGKKQLVFSPIHGIDNVLLNATVINLNKCLQNDFDNHTARHLKSRNFVSQSKSLSAIIKCQNCGEIYKVADEDTNDCDILFQCEKCGNDMGVRFFGYCGHCQVIVGFTDNPNDSFLETVIKNGLRGYLNPSYGIKGISAMLDNIPRANHAGICMCCGNRHIQCPGCNKAVLVKKDADITLDVFTCPDCGTKVRHP